MKKSKREVSSLKLSSIAFMKAMIPKINGADSSKNDNQQRQPSTISVQKEQPKKSYPGAL